MERIFVLIGIINQLATTRLNRVLNELDLPMAQFTLLTHFSNNPALGWTVTHLAVVMEANQPAMTKTVQRLLKKGFLRMVQEHKDKRIKCFYLTADGQKRLEQAWEKLAPDVIEISSKWQTTELKQLEELLECLKNQLDEARD